MKFKVEFARIVNEAQLVEAIIEADDEEAARIAFHEGAFDRFLVIKRELRQVTPVGEPKFDKVG